MPRTPPTITLAEAAEIAGLTPDQLAALLVDVEVSPPGQDLPRPPDVLDSVPTWDRSAYRTWALRMGLWLPYRKLRLIGYGGIALATGHTVQYYRKLQRDRTGKVDDMPDPVPKEWREAARDPLPPLMVLFDRALIDPWLIQTGRLNPDRTRKTT